MVMTVRCKTCGKVSTIQFYQNRTLLILRSHEPTDSQVIVTLWEFVQDHLWFVLYYEGYSVVLLFLRRSQSIIQYIYLFDTGKRWTFLVWTVTAVGEC